MVSTQDITEAEARIRPLVRETPVDRSLHLSRLGAAGVYLKLEHLQHTGSFKLRGAANKVLSLDEEQLRGGVIAASTGNHGMGVCYAARHAGTTATIYLPRDVSEQKLATIKHLGGIPVLAAGDCLEAEYSAREAARKSGQVFISPYNDLQVIAGQGTTGLELARQLERIDAVFVAVGGGGLVAGIAAYLKSASPLTRVIGCWPENSRALYECLRAGRIIEVPEEPTISESTAGGVEEGSITFHLCQRLIDDYALVSETEIIEAMRLILNEEHWIIEGSAGVAVAAYLKEREKYAGQNIAIILCGRNISSTKLAGAL
ncbi:MAG: threonine/serine dehydratase [Blastocatellia bacterium]|nr:threonine/serine dehydratase [Blastocatellia bacterium]